MSIKLPKEFENLLDGKYRALVDSALVRYNDIYLNNKLEFFQDYTDHGIRHIEEVLETASNIIDSNSYKYLNSKDIAVLVISVILHDIGMHISKEGLKKILDPDYDKWRITEFDNFSWLEEWVNFFQEAKRFNDEQLVNIFGSESQIISEPNVDDLDDYSRKIYGEYLRRFHHRLAHEIAKGGFPTKINSDNIYLCSDDIEEDIIDLSGLVARSHGLPIRKAVDYLEYKFADAWRAPYNVKVVFLMVVLRISDYLQIHSERASKVVLKSKKFDSPVSKREWEKHNAVRDINIQTSDPERIFVLAKPNNSLIYLELEKLFLDIQSELDISWAILGETYGKDEELKNLKIKFRRIRSILDDRERFNKTVDYIPEKVFFNADPALLKLLIGPLYGEDPKYGVRELLQNSVDAIKEREYLFGSEGIITITLTPIKKDKLRYEIVIADSGIGMTKDTIINYFFKAGASFRKSMTWKKNFVDGHEAKVQKTGRFGVGVLAVFLLGDEFELWTKYSASNSQGYYCKASLGMSQVELVKQDCDIGTKIRITLKDSVNTIINNKKKDIEEFIKSRNSYIADRPQELEWFTWYLMHRPTINYEVDKTVIKVFRFAKSGLKLSNNPDKVTKNWRSFRTKLFTSIHWIVDLEDPDRYYFYDEDPARFDYYEKLVCNGFKIDRGYQVQDPTYKWSLPKISIFDNDANLPLSLSRDYLQDDKLPIEEELLEDISKEIINSLLKTKFRKIGPYYIPDPNILGFIGGIDLSKFVIVTDDEFTLLDPIIFDKLKFSTFHQFWLRHQTRSENYKFDPAFGYQATVISSDPNYFYKNMLEGNRSSEPQFRGWFSVGNSENSHRQDSFSRTYLATDKLKYLFQGNRLSKTFKDLAIKEVKDKNWSELKTPSSQSPNTSVDFKRISPEVYPLIIESFTNPMIDQNNFFIRAWKKHLGEEWTFPIDPLKRPRLQ